MDGIYALETFCVLLQNPNGIHPGRQDLEFQYSLSKCHALGICAISLVETKLNWNNNTSSSASRQFATTWNFSSLSSSHVDENFTSSHQPGGTLTAYSGG